jgi:hypothetical protein
MSNKEILAIYKIAEKHWSRPAWLCWILGWNGTDHGLCWYFECKHRQYFMSKSFVKLWIPYRTNYSKSAYHFHTRKERLQAIRNVIKDLGNEQ